MQGLHELGDMDDPINAWIFGQRDELFKYRLIGSHKTQSGQKYEAGEVGMDATCLSFPQHA